MIIYVCIWYNIYIYTLCEEGEINRVAGLVVARHCNSYQDAA